VHCGYCDFNTYTAKEIGPVKQADFHLPLIQEIEFSRAVLSESGISLPKLTSIFFGGGTPSLFSIEQIQALVSALSAAHGVMPGADITIEANPDTVDEQYLKRLASIGVNRVSIGVQSFDKEVLRTLDRTHDADLVPLVVQWAKAAGLRVSIDLIYGAPGETLASWSRTLERAIELST
jgi:oxygen-independent coproporphyrinogen-3 oxidase